MDMMKIMKHAQDMQKKLKETQSELSNMEFTGESAGGAVKVICDGQGKLKSIKLKADVINPDNPSSVDQDTIEMLEDVILTAVSQATTTANAQMESRIKALTGGVNIPGLFQ